MIIGSLCFVWILSLAVFAVCIRKAPIGFEDEAGFHYGDERSSTESPDKERAPRVPPTKTPELISS